MTDAAGKETTWKQAFGSVALVFLLLGALGAFLWFLIREISRLDSNVAAASIGATATVLVSAIAVFSGRHLERKKELEAAVLAVTRNSGMAATRTPGTWPRKSRLMASRPPDESLDQRHHPLAAKCLGKTLRVTFGDDNMTMMKQPVHGRTGCFIMVML